MTPTGLVIGAERRLKERDEYRGPPTCKSSFYKYGMVLTGSWWRPPKYKFASIGSGDAALMLPPVKLPSGLTCGRILGLLEGGSKGGGEAAFGLSLEP